MPSWLPVALTIADFVAQRVESVGPVSFEPPEKQPPEQVQASLDPAADSETTGGEASTAPRTDTAADDDSPTMGFQACRGGAADSSSGVESRDEGDMDAEDDDVNERRCSFRSMRVRDRPTTYEV